MNRGCSHHRNTSCMVPPTSLGPAHAYSPMNEPQGRVAHRCQGFSRSSPLSTDELRREIISLGLELERVESREVEGEFARE